MWSRESVGRDSLQISIRERDSSLSAQCVLCCWFSIASHTRVFRGFGGALKQNFQEYLSSISLSQKNFLLIELQRALLIYFMWARQCFSCLLFQRIVTHSHLPQWMADPLILHELSVLLLVNCCTLYNNLYYLKTFSSLTVSLSCELASNYVSVAFNALLLHVLQLQYRTALGREWEREGEEREMEGRLKERQLRERERERERIYITNVYRNNIYFINICLLIIAFKQNGITLFAKNNY